jgi:hypothetical protein
MAESAAMPTRSAQRARCSGLQFDVVIVFIVLFWAWRSTVCVHGGFGIGREITPARVPQSIEPTSFTASSILTLGAGSVVSKSV